MKERGDVLEKLKTYFENKPEVVIALLFGSQAENRANAASDWDIGIYFKPKEYSELETSSDYPNESKIWSELINITGSDLVDLVVLNRASPSLLYQTLQKGEPISIKNRGLYLDLLNKSGYEAADWWDFVADYWQISERSKSLAPENKARIIEYLRFLENEYEELDAIKKITWKNYLEDGFKRKIIERWVENMAMSALDIAKVVLASEKKEAPSSYKETLRTFAILHLDLSPEEAESFGEIARLRNIVVHDYLDLKWKRISAFVAKAETLYPNFIARAKEIINQD